MGPLAAGQVALVHFPFSDLNGVQTAPGGCAGGSLARGLGSLPNHQQVLRRSQGGATERRRLRAGLLAHHQLRFGLGVARAERRHAAGFAAAMAL